MSNSNEVNDDDLIEIEFLFGCDSDMTEFGIFVKSEVPLNKDEIADAIRHWVQEFEKDSKDIIDLGRNIQFSFSFNKELAPPEH